MSANSIAQHPASVDAYIRHGWSLVPIPHGTKGPQHPGWNRKDMALKSQATLPPGFGIGLAHAYSGTMALDIDDWNAAYPILLLAGVDLQALYDAPDAVVVDSGRQGHGKLLFQMPFGMALPSKKIVIDGTTIYELRCATANGLTVQDVLPPSTHPSTGQPYRWAGKGHWTRLPLIPQALLDIWQVFLQHDAAPALPTEAGDVSWDEITAALNSIPPDCDRQKWIDCGMALHYAGTHVQDLDRAFAIWDQWSTGAPHKYPGQREMVVQWRSFRSDKTSTVKLGTLFKHAKDNGWVKPPPDVAKLFAAVQPSLPPTVVMGSMTPEPPQCDMSLGPEVLARRAREVGESVGCDPIIPFFAGLAAVSGAVDARTRLEIRPGYEVPPIIWAMTIGDPAGKKSPGSKLMFPILKSLESEDRSRYAKDMQVFEFLDAQHASAKKAFLDLAKDPNMLLDGSIPAGYGEPPKAPAPLTILVDDATSQKAVRTAAENDRGLLLYMDEMKQWLDRVTDKHSGEGRSTWVRAYEGDSYRMDRVGSGTIHAECFAISMYGNLQPKVFTDLLPLMASDGLLQRFIPVLARDSMIHKGRGIPAHETNVAEYEMMIRRVFGMPALTYRLSPEAYTVFDQFQDWYDTKRKDEKLLQAGEVFTTALGKSEGLLGRLTLLWHMMQDPYSIEVPVATIEQVVKLVKGYIIPAMRFAYDEKLGGEGSFDRWVSDYMIQHSDTKTITMSELRRAARRKIGSSSQWEQYQKVLMAMASLEQNGWVARLDDDSQLNQGRATWVINDKLVNAFPDYRKAVIAAKQRRLEETYKLSTKEKPKVHGWEPSMTMAPEDPY